MRKALVVAAWSLLLTSYGMAQTYVGNFDSASCSQLSGWAYAIEYPNVGISVDIYDGPNRVQASAPANLYRWDVQQYVSNDNGNHGFSITPPAALIDGKQHTVYIKFNGSQILLGSEPKVIQCTSTSQGYTYYHQSNFAGDASWTSYGTVSIANNLFTSSGQGAWVSNIGVPDGTSNYEVNTVLSLKESGGSYIHYLRVTGNPLANGSAIQVMLDDPQVVNGGCTANLTVSDIINGSTTTNASWTVPCADAMEMRSFTAGGGVGVILGGTLYWVGTQVSSGQPGIGAANAPSDNGFTLAALGLRDSVPPNAVSSSSVKTYLTPNEVDLSWDGVADDANGVGVMYYIVFRSRTAAIMPTRA